MQEETGHESGHLRGINADFKTENMSKENAAEIQAELVNQDCLVDLERFTGRSFEELALIISQIVQTKELVDEKLNVKMSLSLLREYIWAN